jgi:spore coat protein CotH
MYDHDICAKYHFPEYEEISSEQMAYIKQRFDELEDVLNSDGFADKENGYSKYIDVENFINYQLMTEFCQNPDGYRLSTYIYKRRDSVDPRFKITPWDYNMTFGNNIAAGDFLYEQWVYEKGQKAGLLGKLPVPFWWKRLTEDEAYWKRMKERWAELRTSTLSDQHVTEMMDSLVNEVTIGGACERNYQAWPIWDKEIPLAPTTATNYSEEIALMREWIKKQVAWIDGQLGFAPTSILSIHDAPADHDAWYDLQGRKFTNKPTDRGIYIHQGNKEVIK